MEVEGEEGEGERATLLSTPRRRRRYNASLIGGSVGSSPISSPRSSPKSSKAAVPPTPGGTVLLPATFAESGHGGVHQPFVVEVPQRTQQKEGAAPSRRGWQKLRDALTRGRSRGRSRSLSREPQGAAAAAEVVEQPQFLSTKTPLPLADVVEPPQTPTVVGRRRRPPQPSPDI